MNTIYRITITYKDFTRYVEDVSGESEVQRFMDNVDWENVRAIHSVIVL